MVRNDVIQPVPENWTGKILRLTSLMYAQAFQIMIGYALVASQYYCVKTTYSQHNQKSGSFLLIYFDDSLVL